MDWDHLKDRASAYGRLMRLHRPIGTLLLLWPVLWGLWIAAGGIPDTKVLLVFVLGTFSMRSAGCVINDFADRNIDAHVKRTRDRPFATGAVSVKEALILFLVLVVISAALVSTMNRLTFHLSLVGVVLAIIYPFMKRYTYIPQIFLGVAFGWGRADGICGTDEFSATCGLGSDGGGCALGNDLRYRICHGRPGRRY